MMDGLRKAVSYVTLGTMLATGCSMHQQSEVSSPAPQIPPPQVENSALDNLVEEAVPHLKRTADRFGTKCDNDYWLRNVGYKVPSSGEEDFVRVDVKVNYSVNDTTGFLALVKNLYTHENPGGFFKGIYLPVRVDSTGITPKLSETRVMTYDMGYSEEIRDYRRALAFCDQEAINEFQEEHTRNPFWNSEVLDLLRALRNLEEEKN